MLPAVNVFACTLATWPSLKRRSFRKTWRWVAAKQPRGRSDSHRSLSGLLCIFLSNVAKEEKHGKSWCPNWNGAKCGTSGFILLLMLSQTSGDVKKLPKTSMVFSIPNFLNHGFRISTRGKPLRRFLVEAYLWWLVEPPICSQICAKETVQLVDSTPFNRGETYQNIWVATT